MAPIPHEILLRAEQVSLAIKGPALLQAGWNAGANGDPRPESPQHSNGVDVPMKRQSFLMATGSTGKLIALPGLSGSDAQFGVCRGSLFRRGRPEGLLPGADADTRYRLD